MTPTEHEATVAVDAAARALWATRSEQPFDELHPINQNGIREHVLPLVWAALEALPDRVAHHNTGGLMLTYILALNCETCGERMTNRVGDLTATPGDEPVIDLDLAVSQTTFECDACGGITYTGDLEDICEHEPGREGDDEDDQ